MSQYLTVYPTHPQQRLLTRAAEIVAGGGLLVYPTDTTYALGCHIGDKQALQRIRRIRQLDDKHQFTLTCRDLSEIANYARVSDPNYRILKHFTPGPFTFVLPATKEVPKRLVHAKRRTIGLRIPDHPVALGVLESLGEPMMTTTMRLPGADLPLSDPEDIRDLVSNLVEVIVDGGACGLVSTTVVDLTGEAPEIIRQGLGDFA